MAGNSCIWRATNDNAQHNCPESSVTDKIEFNAGTLPDNRGHVRSTFADLDTSIAENDKPFQPLNELQSTKLSRISFTVIGVIDNPSVNNIAKTFKIWEIEDNVNSVFTKGRFGLRIDDFPSFNLTPTSLAGGTPRGYLLGNVHLEKDVDLNRLTFTCQLRFNGDKGTAGSGYDW